MTSSPFDSDVPRVALYSPAFAADPHGHYRAMRAEYGSLVPVDLAPGVPATLVIGYRTAVRILHDPNHFPADPRAWEKHVPADCPVKPMLEWRPNAIRTTGAEHQRYREANVAAIAAVDLHQLHSIVEDIAVPLINGFCERGSADLLAEYATPLAFQVINTMLGCPPEIGQRVAAGIMAMFEGNDAADGNAMLIAALTELVTHKHEQPGDDITTRLIGHAAGLSDREVVEQLVPLYGAGVEPTLNLITNTLLSTLVDEGFAGDIHGGSLSTRDALDESLYSDPPIANFCMTYPRQPILIDDVWLPAHQPVVISIAACNNDPTIGTAYHPGNRAHLAWGAGPHACPARQAAYLIAQDGVDQLLDALPDIRLAGPAGALQWRPGPFHRALAALPVVFPPSRPFDLPPQANRAVAPVAAN
ncbi:cytochrome P450 [Nocardia blacklockiae]|uniref:cytochrome P450 n=1 Tax=Nocardia blacklockiae TaxID=480036 RepID=UPI00189540F0|nr:cytochrome P450 [Nocardia blacklockiae]MBF6175779.1 cytochrome P450 [Nocardia blacklockiae]